VLYINDIDDSVSSKILKFADKIFNTVCSECKVMHLGYNNPSVDYSTDAVQLQVVHEEDLGVVVTDDLKWENQCVAAVKQANKVLGMIKTQLYRVNERNNYGTIQISR